MDIIKTIILGIIEGITEWLPVSSTGHLILAEEFMKLKNVSGNFWEVFLVVIQLGAIMAVAAAFFKKLNPFSKQKTIREKNSTYRLWFKIIVGCLPAGIIGFLFDDIIDKTFYNFITVAIMLIIYGILFIFVETRNEAKTPKITNLEQLDYKTALIIGGFQVLAIIPGTSRYVAAEFSFFLAIPVMFGASLLKIVKYIAEHGMFSAFEVFLIFLGMLTAFIVSIIAIKFLMKYIKKNDFKAFGYYRIVLGVILIIYWLLSSKPA